jgi:hypothetical protein
MIHKSLACLVLVFACACSRADRRSADAATRPDRPVTAEQLGPGGFQLAALDPGPGGVSRYLASVGTPVHCEFEIAIEPAKPTEDARFSFASAELIRRPQADCREFLRGLSAYLGFTGNLPMLPPAERVSATIAILGTNYSRAGEGGFSASPTGHWTAAKLFLADGEGEVYLNLNSRDQVGEFATKDEEYAAEVVTELAKILHPVR